MPRFVDIATRAPARERSPFELVRDFFYDAHNYIHELDVLAEELAGQLGDRVLRRGRLASRMQEDLGVTVRFPGRAHAAASTLTPESLRFATASPKPS